MNITVVSNYQVEVNVAIIVFLSADFANFKSSKTWKMYENEKTKL